MLGQSAINGRIPSGSNIKCNKFRGLLRAGIAIKQPKNRGAPRFVINTFQ